MCVGGILAVTLMGLHIPNSVSASESPCGYIFCDPNNNSSMLSVNAPIVTTYWRIVWGIPILIGLLQVTLMLTVFRYDTPVTLKQRGDYDNLTALLKKIYA